MTSSSAVCACAASGVAATVISAAEAPDNILFLVPLKFIGYSSIWVSVGLIGEIMMTSLFIRFPENPESRRMRSNASLSVYFPLIGLTRKCCT